MSNTSPIFKEYYIILEKYPEYKFFVDEVFIIKINVNYDFFFLNYKRTP